MKMVMEKTDIVIKLKEKIAIAEANNDAIVMQLKKLLDKVLATNTKSSSILKGILHENITFTCNMSRL